MKNIVLFGFMGTGKTATGKKLADHLDMEFVEMDGIIEQREGMTINDIFAKKGEPYFRELETRIARELGERQNLVVSTGGGVVLNQRNIEALEKNGILICLQAAPEEIYRRVAAETHRPLLNVSDPLARIKELLLVRQPYYNRIEDQIETTGMSLDQVISAVEKIIKRKAG